MKTLAKITVFLLTAAVVVLAARYALRNDAPQLTINAQPGAAVYVDGQYRGITPVSVSRLDVGKHLVRLTHEGFLPHETVVDIPASEPVSATLSPVPPAKLTITSDPAGATILLDGSPSGHTPHTIDVAEPGPHHIELVKTNYLPISRNVVLESGAETTERFALDHRQEKAYRARIKQDPYDIAAYNDLGELLYVIGRYKDAADVIVEGWIALDSPEAKKRTDYRNRYNLGKYQHEARNKHSAPGFQDALNRRTLKAVLDGESSSFILTDFRRIPGKKYMPDYVKALDFLIEKTEKNWPQLLTFAVHYQDAGLQDKSIALIERVSELHPTAWSVQQRCVQTSRDIYKRYRNAAWKKAVAGWMEKLEKVTKPQASVHVALLNYEKATLAKVEKRNEDYETFMQAAIAKHPTELNQGLWQFELAKHYKALKKYEQEAALLHTIMVNKSMKNRREYNQVRALIKQLPEKLRKPPGPKVEPKPLAK